MVVGPDLCGAKGIRTPDLLSARQMLYQLSYGPLYLILSRFGVDLTTPIRVVPPVTAFGAIGSLLLPGGLAHISQSGVRMGNRYCSAGQPVHGHGPHAPAHMAASAAGPGGRRSAVVAEDGLGQ